MHGTGPRSPLKDCSKDELLKRGLATKGALPLLLGSWNIRVSSGDGTASSKLAQSIREVEEAALAGDVVAQESMAVLKYYGMRTTGSPPPFPRASGRPGPTGASALRHKSKKLGKLKKVLNAKTRKASPPSAPWIPSSKSEARNWWKLAAEQGSLISKAALYYDGTVEGELTWSSEDEMSTHSSDNNHSQSADQFALDQASPAARKRKRHSSESGTIVITSPTSGKLCLSKKKKKRNFKKAFEYWTKAVEETGDPSATNFLGLMYDRGEGTTKDTKRAQELYTKAAEAGFPPAMNNLAVVYELGEGVESDFETAWQLYLSAANLGHPKAISNLALGWEFGQNPIGERDHDQAVKLFHQAVLLGDQTAIFNLAEYYIEGRGVAKDFDRAKAMYTTLIKEDVGRAFYSLAMLHINPDFEGDPVENNAIAVELLKKGIEHDHTTSLNHLGYIYHYGAPGIERDHSKALALYKLAAAKDDPYAQFSIGFMYKYGQGLERNTEKAIEFIQKAAEKNFGPALYRLAMLCKSGDGVEKDNKKYVSLLSRAVAEGERKAKEELQKAFCELVLLANCSAKAGGSETKSQDKAKRDFSSTLKERCGLLFQIQKHLNAEQWAQKLLVDDTLQDYVRERNARSSPAGYRDLVSLVYKIAMAKNKSGDMGLDVLQAAIGVLRAGVTVKPSSPPSSPTSSPSASPRGVSVHFVLKNELRPLEDAIAECRAAQKRMYSAKALVTLAHTAVTPGESTHNPFAFLPLELVVHILSFLSLEDYREQSGSSV